MTLRPFRERVLQAVLFEAGGLLIATPVYRAASGNPMSEAFAVIAALALAVLIWAPLYNLGFDRVEWHLTRRLASDRPMVMRLLHAALQELSVLILTLPILIHLGGLTIWQALLADIGLTALYGLYALLFYRLYDWLRPVRPHFQEGFSQ